MTFGNYVACLQIRDYRIDYSTNISTVLSNGYVSVKIYKSTLAREKMNGLVDLLNKTNFQNDKERLDSSEPLLFNF